MGRPPIDPHAQRGVRGKQPVWDVFLGLRQAGLPSPLPQKAFRETLPICSVRDPITIGPYASPHRLPPGASAQDHVNHQVRGDRCPPDSRSE